MRVWLIAIGEPLPTDGENVRLLRTGILANMKPKLQTTSVVRGE